MSRKSKKKKITLDDEEEQKEDLLFYFDNIDTVIIYGRHYKRVPYDGVLGRACKGCHVSYKKLHKVACQYEVCPYCKGSSWDCPCDPDIENAERDNYVECMNEMGS